MSEIDKLVDKMTERYSGMQPGGYSMAARDCMQVVAVIVAMTKTQSCDSVRVGDVPLHTDDLSAYVRGWRAAADEIRAAGERAAKGEG